MIERTFQLVRGVGPWREKDLWARGLFHWDQFTPGSTAGGVILSGKLDPLVREAIDRLRPALAEGHLAELAAGIPSREHWRLFARFRDQAAFLDIEAEDAKDPKPTVVSIFDSSGLRAFIQGRNLEQLPDALAERPIWVTFNGSSFDIPVLKRTFPELGSPTVHLDLRHLARRVGLEGGLKRVEDEAGLSRPLHLRGVGGYDAVLLWRAYKRGGSLEALRMLVEYNLYDAFQLRPLAEHCFNRMLDRYAFDESLEPRLSVLDRGELLYDVSKLLLSISPTDADLALLNRLRSQDRDISQEL